MASLALGVAGAVAGGFFGGPLGASIGFSLGSAVGGALFPQSTPDQNIATEGPRLADLKVQSSTYGNMIPIIYGTIRVTGNMIWATNIIETPHVSTTTQDAQGGKGGGGGGSTTQTTTTYTYSINAAFGMCEGEIVGVRRIWANGNLIFDQRASNSGVSSSFSISGNGGNVIIYPGSETQLPDPTIQADKGVANTPAFRGLAYAMFNGFQLADYGNSIPNFTFEIVRNGAVTIPGTTILNAIVSSQPFVISNPFDGCIYAVDVTATTIYKLDPTTNTVIISRTQSLYGNFNTFFYNQVNAQLYFATTGGSFYLIDPTTLIPVFAWDSTALSHIGGQPYPYVQYSDTVLSRIYGTFITVPSAPNPFFTGISVLTGNGPDNTNAIFQYRFSNIAFQGLAFDNATGYLWGYNDYTLTTYPVQLWFWNVRSGLGAPMTSSLTLPLTASGSPSILCGLIDPVTHRLMVYYIASDSNYYITKVDLSSIAIISTTQVPGLFAGPPPLLNTIENKVFWFSNDHTVSLYNVKDDALTTIPYPYVKVDDIGSVTYDPRTDSMIWGLNDHTVHDCIFRIVGPRVERTNHSLAFVVTDLCERVNLTAADIDVTALTPEVDGYYIANVTQVRAALQQLMQAYYFDAVESDNIIKFVPRGGSSAVTITQEDLAAHKYGDNLPDIVTITRTQDLDLPSTVNMTYFNEDQDYAQGTQYSTRAAKIVEKVTAYNFPMAFTNDSAKGIVNTLLFDFWVSRTSYKFQTDYSYMAYEPTDVITLENANATYLIRITKKTIQAGLIMFEGLDEEPSIYNQNAVGSGPDVPDTKIALESLTRLFYLDIPQLRDGDNTPGIYLAVAPSNPAATWTGATVARSADAGNSYQDASTFFEAAACGVTTTTLPDWTGENYWDYTSKVRVHMINGTLSSVSELQALNGANLAIIGSELIIFRTATQISTGVYDLTNFLRARFGTEQYTSTHTDVENFIVLTVQTAHRVVETLNDINAIRIFRAVTFRTQLFTATAIPEVDTGVSLKPLSPIDLYGVRNIPASNDITINWTRRTRIGGGWNDYADVPLGEASEAYEVDILNGSDVVRTLTSTTNTVIYTAAEQVIDFGTHQTTVDVNIYQMSASVGRGFPGSGTV